MSSPPPPDTSSVRQGEEIDATKLSAFLNAQPGLDCGDVAVLQFSAGSSNLTYLIRVGGVEFVLRRPPFGNTVKTAHDMEREFRVLCRLSKVYPPAPKPILFCDDVTVIGSEFYLMERRRGLIIRGRAPQELIDSPELQRPICESFIQNLVDLHSLDYKRAGLADLGKPEGYCGRQVQGWTKRYVAAKTDELPEIDRVISWLNDNIPSASNAALVHNDYKFDNIMLDPDDFTKITAVLDWEMVTIGDPLMDLGTTLGYWMSADAGDAMLNMPFNPRVLMENISRKDLVEMYAASSRHEIPNMLFYYVFGTVKIAVIAQQIYARFVKGLTKDPRFKQLDVFVSKLVSIAHNAIDRASLE